MEYKINLLRHKAQKMDKSWRLESTSTTKEFERTIQEKEFDDWLLIIRNKDK